MTRLAQKGHAFKFALFTGEAGTYRLPKLIIEKKAIENLSKKYGQAVANVTMLVTS